MPRLVTVQTPWHDPQALRSACQELDWPCPPHGAVTLPGITIIGYQLELPGQPSLVVLDTLTGLLRCVLHDGETFPSVPLVHLRRAYAAAQAQRHAARDSASTSADLSHPTTILSLEEA